MCGRYAITLPPEAMAQLFEAVPSNDLPPVPNYNVCPTNQVHVVRGDGGGGRRLVAMRWGFVPGWYKSPTDGPLLINARAETVAEKPAFGRAVRERRCIVPASGFYEWQIGPDRARLPWYVFRADGAPLALAGLWQDWEHDDTRLTTCAILTTEANQAMRAVHHRMPVVLEPADTALWLGEAGHGAARLMRPADEAVLRLHRVGTAVNSNRAEGSELIEPLTDQ